MVYKKLAKIALSVMTVLSFVTACSPEKELGTAENPVKIYFMPGEGSADKVAQDVKIFKDYVEKETKYSVNTTIATDYIKIIEDMGYRKADVAFINTLGYIMAADCCRAEAALSFIYGKNLKSYKGIIIANKDSNITKIEDINAKTFAFVDTYSTTGFLLPLKLFQDKKVKPSKTITANSHSNVVSMVYKKEADAGATYYEPDENGKIKDGRHEVLKMYPDVADKVKIVGYTDEVPNNPLAFQKDISQEMKDKLADTIIKFSQTPEGGKILKDMYGITGFMKTKDSDYDGVRKIVKSLGKEVEDLIPGGFKIYAAKVRFTGVDIP